MRMNCDDSYIFVPFALVNPVIIRYNSTEHRAQSTEHRAQSTEHRAQSTEPLIPFSRGVFFSSLNLSVPVRGAAFFQMGDNDAVCGGSFASANVAFVYTFKFRGVECVPPETP
jgi:hypothetical protein